MTTSIHRVWPVARRQHGVITNAQLRAIGLTPAAIRHWLTVGHLYLLHRGIYAVGNPQVTRRGTWMAAVLACGSLAVLSHESAAALWGIRPDRSRPTEVTVPQNKRRRPKGIRTHQSRTLEPRDVTTRHGIPVTTPVRTLIDLAPRLPRNQAERAINEADRLGLVTPDRLRRALATGSDKHGAAALATLLDRRTFTLTDSELERLLVPIALKAGLGLPQTGCVVNGFKVDFYWPELGLVVETDGLRYHRTPAQQARDRVRDQAHAAAGLTCLRFTHEQIAFEAEYVEGILVAVRERLCS